MAALVTDDQQPTPLDDLLAALPDGLELGHLLANITHGRDARHGEMLAMIARQTTVALFVATELGAQRIPVGLAVKRLRDTAAITYMATMGRDRFAALEAEDTRRRTEALSGVGS